jgi:hypothetical protein
MAAGQAQVISVIIPIMPIEPYKTQIHDTLKSLKKQTAKHEVIVCEQPIERWINKGKLLNEGFRKSKGDVIFHCDADALFPDPTLFERMKNKLESGYDCVYPMFFSPLKKVYKIADGHPFATREAREEFGPHNERHLGISLQEFVILHHYLTKKKMYCGKEFMMAINMKPFVKGVGKLHKETRIKVKPIYYQCLEILKERGVWPD